MTGLVVGVPVATVWTGPDAPRAQDEPAVRDVPDVAAWARAMDGPSRLGLHGRTLTQALLGEPIEIVEERGDWAQVLLPDQPSSSDAEGYPGWVRRAHLAPAAPGSATTVTVMATESTAELADGLRLRLSFGTRLPLLEHDADGVHVALPGSRTASLPTSQVCASDAPCKSPELLASARQFVGLRYLWGGTSAWGLDCSGLVHLVHRAQGHRVPRDAFDQHAAAAPVPLATASAGNGGLYFFARAGERVFHVGLASNAAHAPQSMVHAPEGDGDDRIEDAPLTGHRAATLVAAGSFLSAL